jgi:tetratricopeptide (TPR) repeat protein
VAEANRQIRDSHEEIARARKQLAETALQISNLVETVEKKDSDIKSLESRLADLREFVQQRSVAAADPDPNWLQRLVLEALILVTLVTLVGVLAVTLSRWNDARRRMGSNVESGAIALEFHAPTFNPAPPPAAPVEDEEAAELPAEDPLAETDDAEQASTDHTEHEEIELHGDQLMEANAYLAYGYHEKAKEVLEEFIKENPAHAESRLVMLRALHAIKEQRKFRRHAEALLELVDDEYDERWIEAARLGRAILPEERLFDVAVHKRTEDEKFEQTVWTGARANTTDEDDHTYLDFDEFKYVDLFLLDGGGAAPDVQDPTTPATSAEKVEAKTEAELAKWRADMLGTEEDRGVRLDPDAPTDDSTDVPDDEPLDDPVDVLDDEPLDDPVDVPGDGPLDGPIDFSLDDPTEMFLDIPTDVPTDIPTDDKH